MVLEAFRDKNDALMVGWFETKRPIGPANSIIRNTDTTTAAIMTRTSSTMPTAVMIESSENTRSITMIWSRTEGRVALTVLDFCSCAPSSD